jgi:hypothetical protein
MPHSTLPLHLAMFVAAGLQTIQFLLKEKLFSGRYILALWVFFGATFSSTF